MAGMTDEERGDVFRGVFGTVGGLRAVDRDSRRRALMDAARIADETHERSVRDNDGQYWAGETDWAVVAAWLRTIWYAEEEPDDPDNSDRLRERIALWDRIAQRRVEEDMQRRRASDG